MARRPMTPLEEPQVSESASDALASTEDEPIEGGPAEHGLEDAVEHRTVVPSSIAMVSLLGAGDELIRVVEDEVPGLDVHVRGNEITLHGPSQEVVLVERLLDELIAVIRTGQGLTPDSVRRSLAMLRGGGDRPAEVFGYDILSHRGRTIRPKTLNQKRYVDAITTSTVTFGIGPAGTGKTYLAVAAAVRALQAKEINRIILTRPAVEAGEHLGFLPGTLSEKIDPYLRPLYDALHDMMDPHSIPRLMTEGTIEVAPLAYMRGRTLNDAFIILDEAQNTSIEQMKMFLTRLGFSSRMVVTGDITQVDLPGEKSSGLADGLRVLADIPDIAICQLTSRDVVRHPLVGAIVDAYDQHGKPRAAARR
jgi:phosphate starvation-inducible PhoH-like protein